MIKQQYNVYNQAQVNEYTIQQLIVVTSSTCEMCEKRIYPSYTHDRPHKSSGTSLWSWLWKWELWLITGWSYIQEILDRLSGI